MKNNKILHVFDVEGGAGLGDYNDNKSTCVGVCVYVLVCT